MKLYQLHVSEALVVRGLATVSTEGRLSSSEARRRFGCKKGRSYVCRAPVSLSTSCASLCTPLCAAISDHKALELSWRAGDGRAHAS
eukprot:1954591-Pyramimonas_sp.AAC.1